MVKKLFIVHVVGFVVVLNILLPHVQLEKGSNLRTSFFYYLFYGPISPETLIALTAFYPVFVSIIVLFFNNLIVQNFGRLILFFLGVLGLLSTVLLWVLMHLHLDVRIESFCFSYYSTLTLQVFFSLVCVLFSITGKSGMRSLSAVLGVPENGNGGH